MGADQEQKPYQNEKAYRIEKAPYYAERVLNIPSSTQITVNEMEYTAETIKKVLGGI